MGSGWHEWPLVIFTVLGQYVAGGVSVIALGMLLGVREDTERRHVQFMFFPLWILLGIGFFASFMHLGLPFRAVNALNQIGKSNLSNEIGIGTVFFIFGGVYWLLGFLNKLPAKIDKIWLLIIIILAICFVWSMTRVYMIDTVPTWNNGYTPLSFFMAMFTGGALLGYIVLTFCKVESFMIRWLPLVGVLSALVSLLFMAIQGVGLSKIYSSAQQASQLIPYFGEIFLLRALVLLLGLGVWVIPLFRGNKASLYGMLISFVLIVISEFIGRGIFYGLHMTVGMAVNG